jgi:hypothetical protein
MSLLVHSTVGILGPQAEEDVNDPPIAAIAVA